MMLKTVWSIVRGDPEAIQSILWLLTIGMAMLALAGLFDLPGILTGFFAAGFGVCAASLNDWRKERGLWMLAATYFAVYLFVYACIVIGQIRDAQWGVQPNSLALVLDFSIGTFLLTANLRFLSKVAKQNYALTRAAVQHDNY